MQTTHYVQVAIVPPKDRLLKNLGKCKVSSGRGLGSMDQGHCRLNTERLSYVISGYGMVTVAITCCCWLLALEPSLYVLTKLDMLVEPLVVLPK